MSISVSIVEDDAGVRASLARLIDGAPGFRCLSEHPTAESALREMPKTSPEVVLMDINLPGMSGVECVKRLKPLLPGTQVIMLTVYQNTEHIFKALAAGATGYLLKQTPPAELLDAIRDVRKRSESNVATTHILSSSDSTGFVAVARGQDKSGRDFHGVGRGKSQAEADKKAFDLLNEADAGAEQKIVYRYFSYGGPSSPRRVFDRTGH